MSHESRRYDFSMADAAYAELARDLRALLSGERDLIANAANTAALIHDALPDLNWAGFYLYKEGELVLGPFQGKPACVRISRPSVRQPASASSFTTGRIAVSRSRH